MCFMLLLNSILGPDLYLVLIEFTAGVKVGNCSNGNDSIKTVVLVIQDLIFLLTHLQKRGGVEVDDYKDNSRDQKNIY